MKLYIIIYNVVTVCTGCILKCKTDIGPLASGIVQYANDFSFVFLFVNNMIQGNLNLYTIQLLKLFRV